MAIFICIIEILNEILVYLKFLSKYTFQNTTRIQLFQIQKKETKLYS